MLSLSGREQCMAKGLVLCVQPKSPGFECTKSNPIKHLFPGTSFG